jgi:hypothetical protein
MEKSKDKQKDKNKSNLFNWILDCIKKDYFIIILCCLALTGCIYTLATVGSYQNKINEHWMDQWDSICVQYDPIGQTPDPANITLDYWGDYSGID